MLREAHPVHVYHSLREGLSVGQSSSVSDRVGRLDGDRAARSAEQSSQEELNCHDCEVRIRINKQNSDIAGDVHIGKCDPDDLCAMNEMQTKLLHDVQCHEAETSDFRQFEGLLQLREKQLENDVCQMQVCFVARLSQRECVGNVVKCA